MSDCKFPILMKAWEGATSVEDRTILLDVYNKIITDTTHGPDPAHLEVWNFFTKSAVSELNQVLVMDKPGIMPVYHPGFLPQGHRWAPQRQLAAKGMHWIAYNPLAIESKISRYDNEKNLFVTEEQIIKALEREAWAFKTSHDFFKELAIAHLFQTSEDFKKVGSIKDDGKDGINMELVDSMVPTDGATNGYPSYQQNLSIDQNFLCWKDGKATLCCKEGETDCKPYQVKTHPLNEILKVLQKCIAKNTISTKKSTMLGIEGAGSEDYAKLFGLLQNIKTVVADMIAIRTSKFNICVDASDPAKCCADDECSKLLKDHNVNLGCCKKCSDTEDKCCCYNQTRADSADLALFVNHQDLISIQEIFPLLQHPAYVEDIAKYVGVGKIFTLPNIKAGEMFVINRKTIGIHPIGDTFLGSANYPEAELTNIWMRMKFHIVLYPFHCVKFTKAA